ncbi:hypothetical protein [Pseudodesulfovibrio indicus]|uniref:hypothetical protein n=1 Tax=Pseudodesulfovibrio indicus TaxID=1716143 RepID=UPI00292CD701|nr:hypothetical protein [Pseudodesulfovibrio indicus]
MERADIERVFEAFFEKYKKTEGDRTSWSAFWSDMSDKGTLEINMTKCPRGTIFKIFVDKKKVTEVSGWDEFFKAMKDLEASHPGLYDEDQFFGEMEFVI